MDEVLEVLGALVAFLALVVLAAGVIAILFLPEFLKLYKEMRNE